MKRRPPDRPVRQPGSALVGFQLPPEVILRGPLVPALRVLSYRDLEELLASVAHHPDTTTIRKMQQCSRVGSPMPYYPSAIIWSDNARFEGRPHVKHDAPSAWRREARPTAPTGDLRPLVR